MPGIIHAFYLIYVAGKRQFTWQGKIIWAQTCFQRSGRNLQTLPTKYLTHNTEETSLVNRSQANASIVTIIFFKIRHLAHHRPTCLPRNKSKSRDHVHMYQKGSIRPQKHTWRGKVQEHLSAINFCILHCIICAGCIVRAVELHKAKPATVYIQQWETTCSVTHDLMEYKGQLKI